MPRDAGIQVDARARDVSDGESKTPEQANGSTGLPRQSCSKAAKNIESNGPVLYSQICLDADRNPN